MNYIVYLHIHICEICKYAIRIMCYGILQFYFSICTLLICLLYTDMLLFENLENASYIYTHTVYLVFPFDIILRAFSSDIKYS